MSRADRGSRLRRLLSWLCGLITALALSVGTLALTLEALGTSADALRALMLRYAPPAVTGLSEADYPRVTALTAGYLAGAVDTYQMEAAVWGEAPAPLFHDYEQAHMSDVRALFDLDRAVLLVCAAALALAVPLLFALRRPRAAALGALTGAAALLAAVCALAVWGLTDFDSLFITFHRVAFTNQLWLLDPATDMLIRLMPIELFIHCAALAGGLWLIVTLATAVVAALFCRRPQPEAPASPTPKETCT